jgi:hypothetical protein
MVSPADPRALVVPLMFALTTKGHPVIAPPGVATQNRSRCLIVVKRGGR